MTAPHATSANFTFHIDRPPNPVGPVFQNVGVYEMLPDASIRIEFKGEVLLPPGKWEVGIVQNCWNDRVTHVYSEGGEFYFSLDGPPVLDVPFGATDIWLNTFGNGVVQLENASGADKRYQVALEGGDTPTSPPIPGILTRCNGQIQEQLVFAERVLQLAGAVVARQDGQLFPIAATAGNTYGFMWRLEPAPGAPTFHFKPLFPSAFELQPPFSLLRPGLGTTRPTANEIGVELVGKATARYLADCGRRKPRSGDVNLST